MWKTDHFSFVHIPKTGGTFVREVIKEMKIGGKEIGWAHSEYTPVNEDEFAFCFVRKPMPWLRSFWMFSRVSPDGWYSGKRWILTSKAHPAFQEFIRKLNAIKIAHPFDSFARALVDRYPGSVTKFQTSYLAKNVRVGETENLIEDLRSFFCMTDLRDRIDEFDEIVESKERVNVSVNAPELTIDLEDYCRGKL